MEQTPDLSQIMRLAQSPTGQQLIHILQNQSGKELQTAIGLAASGKMEQAKAILSRMVNTPETQKLLKQLEEEK